MLIATRGNMKEVSKHWPNNVVFAYSPNTYEKYSANPGDYWYADDDYVIRDSEGEPMRLVTEVTTIVDVDDKAMLKHHDYGVEIIEGQP